MKRHELEKAFNDGSRHVTIRGKQAVVPLKFTKTGSPVTQDTDPRDIILKKLNIPQINFLFHWRASKFTNAAKACQDAGISVDQAEVLAKKLQCFKDEDARVRALAQIPSPDFVAAKNVEGFYEDNLSDGQRDHLKELAKITGAYKTQASVSITQNVFNLPKLSPEAEAKLREIADREADIVDAEVANG